MKLKTPSICASVIAHSVDEFLKVLGNADVRRADLIEIRADGLKVEDDAGRGYKTHIKGLFRRAKFANLPLILTVRMEKEGGVFIGTEAERVDCIKDGIKLADMVDVELRMDEGGRDEIIAAAKSKKVPVILSYHDFKKTPEDDAMMAILEEAENLGAGIAKLAVTANSRADVVRLLNVTQEMSERLKIPLCTISMGELGAISRIAAPVFGSAITYGYVTKETAPGQLPVSELDSALRALGVRE
ncbi:MAG: type I 3-dehydroquinate dehydratase [Candidatus Hydrothermarchaeaceae archaeon]